MEGMVPDIARGRLVIVARVQEGWDGGGGKREKARQAVRVGEALAPAERAIGERGRPV